MLPFEAVFVCLPVYICLSALFVGEIHACADEVGRGAAELRRGSGMSSIEKKIETKKRVEERKKKQMSVSEKEWGQN